MMQGWRKPLGLCALVGLCAGPVTAQERFRLHLTVKSAAWEDDTEIIPPEVVYFVSREDYLVSQDDIDQFVTPQPRERRNGAGFEYGHRAEDAIGDLRYVDRYVHIDIRRPPYVVTNPLLLRVQLEEQNLGAPIVRTIQLDHPKNLAKIYRDEANFILRSGQLNGDRLAQAEASALSAVQHHATSENFLLLVRVIQAGLQIDDAELVFLPETIDDFRAVEGFSSLPSQDQWQVLLEFLEVLARPEVLDRPYGRGATVGDVAILFGGEMVETYNTEFAEGADLPVLKVFRTLSFLHGENGDCLMLIENADLALAAAPEIEMPWTAQRRFYGDWGHCLGLVTGFTQSQSAQEEDALVMSVASDDFLGSLWVDFATTTATAESRLRFSTADEDQEIFALYAFAVRVKLEIEG